MKNETNTDNNLNKRTNRPLEYYIEPENKLPITHNVDVAVVGSGPAGLIAAVASARTGADTLLIEGYSTVFPAVSFGGTSGIFNAFRTCLADNELDIGFEEAAKEANERGYIYKLIGGVPWDFIKFMNENGGLHLENEEDLLLASRLQCDPLGAMNSAIRFLEKEGVRILVQTHACKPIISSNRKVKGLIVENKSGRSAIMSKVLIDCTGEADLAYQAGVPCETGKDLGAGGGSLLWVLKNFPGEPSTTFRSGQDSPNGPDPEIAREIAKAVNFNMSLNIDGVGEILYKSTGHGVIVRGIDGIDAEIISKAEIEARKFAFDFIEFCRKYIPGFENSYIQQLCPQILWRGVRCIIGDYYLTKQEVDEEAQTRFEDSIYLHRAVRYNSSESYMQIPYRIMLPLNVENMLVAGKCASGASTVRGAASCMAMGHAAGTAAALSVKNNVTPRSLNVRILQDTLRAQKAILDKPEKIKLKNKIDISRIHEIYRVGKIAK